MRCFQQQIRLTKFDVVHELQVIMYHQVLFEAAAPAAAKRRHKKAPSSSNTVFCPPVTLVDQQGHKDNVFPSRVSLQ